jgi:hypothetical protein
MRTDFAEIPTLTADELQDAGIVLFGPQWLTPLADALGLRDNKRLREMMSGTRPIPAGFRAELVEMLRGRAGRAIVLADRLEFTSSQPPTPI